MYDPIVGRFTTTDPARQFYSSYVGMGNDPVNGVDPDGGTTLTQGVNSKGEIVYDDGLDDGNVYLVNDGFTGEINDLATLKANSVQLVSDFLWVGTEGQLKNYVSSQFQSAGLPNLPISVKWSHSEGFTMATKRVVYDPDTKGVFVRVNNLKDWFFEIRYNENSQSRIYGNVYDLRNTLIHEKNHLMVTFDMLKHGNGSVFFSNREKAREWSEHQAIDYQRCHSSWGCTSPRFRNYINNYMRHTTAPRK